MTRDEAIAMMKLQLGFRTDQTENIITCLQQGQIDLEQAATKPWFLLSERATILTSADDPRVQLPTDFLLEHEEDGLTYLPGNSGDPVELVKENLDQLKQVYKLTEGAPEAYALDGLYFRIFPIPDDLYTLEMYYYRTDEVLTTNVENKWLKHAPFLLMGKAGRLLSEGPLRDPIATRVFTEWEAKGLIQLYRQNEARKHTNTSMQIGGEA